MSRNHYVVSKNGDKWKVTHNGSFLSNFGTQADADRYAKQSAKITGGEVTTQGRNGKFRSKDSYGNDPRSIRDTEH